MGIKKPPPVGVAEWSIFLEQAEYIKTRLDDQINWYDSKSTYNKKLYLFWQTTSFIAASLVTITAAVDAVFQIPIQPIITATVGSVTVICQSVLAIFKYHELWTEYRRTSELLKKEKYMFSTQTGLYRQAELPFSDLVERAETIISNENINWTNLTSNKKENGE